MACVNKLSNLSRAMCTASTKMVKPPIQVFGLDGRYATALYSAATKMKQLDKVEKDLNALMTTLKENKGLRTSIVSPIVNRKIMSSALLQSGEQLGFAPATSNLLSLLAQNGRLSHVDGIVGAFNIIMAAHRGEVVCEVVSAKPLDASQFKQLEGALRAFLKKNELLKITSRVDPALIGGLVVSIGDKYVDMSIASKVKMYNEVISNAA